MKNKLKAVLLSLSTLLTISLVSCSERVEVPPAHVGLVKTSEGIQPELHEPSSFRLPVAMRTKNQLILVETSHFTEQEDFKIFMPKDDLNFAIKIKGTFAIEKQQAKSIAGKVTASATKDDTILKITGHKVYSTYAEQVLEEKVSDFISKRTIMEVLSNRSKISDELLKEVRLALKGSPISVIRINISDAQPPSIIVDAKVAAKKREVQLKQAEANKNILLKEAETKLAVERKNQEIDLLEAETQVLVEKKLSESVNNAFITQRSLKILQDLAKSDNKVFFLPQEVFQNPSMMVGIHQNAINGKEKSK